ncbi:MAG: hypothetical protein ACFCUT_03020 [Kiloniellaceae bacterium]
MRNALTGALTVAALTALLVASVPATAAAQQTSRYEAKTAERLAELNIDSSEVTSVRYVLIRIGRDRSPDIIGAEAYVRLSRCSGYLVIHMTAATYVRQTYTLGDCRLDGIPAY